MDGGHRTEPRQPHRPRDGAWQQVVSLDDCFCVCSTMFRIDPPHLLWVLEGLVAGRVQNAVRVPEAIARDAKGALDRMLAIS